MWKKRRDSAPKDSTNSRLSKDELKREHKEVVRDEKQLAQKYTEIQAVFQKLEECYQISKATFSVGRYSQLKDMIKKASSDEIINGIKSVIAAHSQASNEKGGLAGLLSKARAFSADQSEEKKTESSGASKSVGKKMSSFFKKVKDVTGFSDEPVEDEDVMTESQLQRDTGRKKRAIQHHITELQKALEALEKLKESYESSKAHAPPKRYIELKDMIKAATADKFT